MAVFRADPAKHTTDRDKRILDRNREFHLAKPKSSPVEVFGTHRHSAIRMPTLGLSPRTALRRGAPFKHQAESGADGSILRAMASASQRAPSRFSEFYIL